MMIMSVKKTSPKGNSFSKPPKKPLKHSSQGGRRKKNLQFSDPGAPK